MSEEADQIGQASRVTRVFSGMQPSGELHIGNWLGALRNWVDLQAKYPCIFCIVDLHALTQNYDPAAMRERIRDMAVGWLAAGLDPDRTTLFVQSTIPEHSELAWILGTVTPLGLLQRMTQYKEKSKIQSTNINAGLLDYPVLQAADILLYKADAVPIGEDQIQHVEFARDLARKFNERYGKTFPEPTALLTRAPRVMGLDGDRKMAKALGNHIALSDPPNMVKKKLAPAKTDTRRKQRADPGVPEDCNMFQYHSFFSTPDQQDWAAEGCRTARIGCRDCKEVVAENLNRLLEPMQARRRELESCPGRVDAILAAGRERMKEVAKETMLEVRERMGIPSRERYVSDGVGR